MKYFGTDGIRGVAGEDLSPELAYKTGRGLALKLKDEYSFVVIGTDTRKSRNLIKLSVISGILSVGLDVIDLGILPTPGVAYFTRKLGAGAGIVISASHNPAKFNGIKLFASDGFKFSDEFQEEIEELIDNPTDYYVSGADVGELKFLEGEYKLYNDFLLSHIDTDFTGVKIAIDCGHGASGLLAEDLFTRAGADVTVINQDFNGLDINDGCGSTNPEVISGLVPSVGADIGLSFDGDADRLIVVDELGNEMDGDHYLAALAYYMDKKGELKGGTVVGTVMSNMGLAKFLEENGLNFVATAVGDKYVMEEMRKMGYNLGGEQSGHFIHLDDHTTGCGLLSALKLIEALVDLNMKASDMNSLMTSYPQVLVNAKVKNESKKKLKEDKEIIDRIGQLEKELAGKGRLLIRPSGTEPLVRVMLEGENEEDLYQKASELADFIENRLA